MNDDDNDYGNILKYHPIFSVPEPCQGDSAEASLQLSTATLPKFIRAELTGDERMLYGRRQIFALKDSDLIVAAGKEIRICSLGDRRRSREAKNAYKVLHTPNIQFDVYQLALNPTGKFLAVAGVSQVGVVVLPRPGYSKLVPNTIDCRSIQVGQFHHASTTSAPVAKIEWHPWGEGGSTLMVMTTDGKLREYDISIDPEEPQQVLSFVPERKNSSYVAEDVSEREVASFTLGKGVADWGPLTMYAVTKSGDIYSICPYMPKNASIPSSYVHALECFIAAKQEFLSQDPSASTAARSFAALYDYQRKYVAALLKQLPPGTAFPATSRSLPMHPPVTIKNLPMRQGPFLLQPSPRTLEGSEGADATDIIYLSFGNREDRGDEEYEGETERLDVVLIVYKDGKVDVCLDVEKVEARWETRPGTSRDLPMLAVYETIDLGLISNLKIASASTSNPPLLDLLQGNHAVLFADPIHDDVIFVYHAFGVHSLDLGPMLRSLSTALRAEEENKGASLSAALEKSTGTIVKPIFTSFSVERRCSSPVVGIAISNDIHLPYSIFILTSPLSVTVLKLMIRLEPSSLASPEATAEPEQSKYLVPPSGPPPYVSLLTDEPYLVPPILSQPFVLSSNPRSSSSSSKEFMLTPEIMRYLGTVVENFTTKIHGVQLAYRGSEVRRELQKQEFKRQQDKCRELLELVERLKGRRSGLTQYKLNAIKETQKGLLKRLDGVLQALMEQASPELSVYELKWFQELKRMKEEVMGLRRFDASSLAARVSLLQREYARLLPDLKKLLEKEREWSKKSAEASQDLGVSQAFQLGEISNHERSKITKLEDQILRLASQLDLSLGHPVLRA